MLVSLTQQLKGRTSLNPGQVSDAVAALVSESETTEGKADFLAALAQKKETPEEIAAFANELRTRSVAVRVHDQTRGNEILDVCGTGGDRLNTFNI